MMICADNTVVFGSAGSGGLSQLLSDLQEPADSAEYRIKIQVGVKSALWPMHPFHACPPTHAAACSRTICHAACLLSHLSSLTLGKH